MTKAAGVMACANASPSSPEVAAETSKPRRSRKRRVTCRSFALSSISTMRWRVGAGSGMKLEIVPLPRGLRGRAVSASRLLQVHRYFSISGCIELSLRQLDRLSEIWVVDGGQLDEIDRPAEQFLDRKLEIEVRMPTVQIDRLELHDEVHIALILVKRPFHSRAKHRQPLDTILRAKSSDLVEMI